jgi:hypothetical protein
VVERRDRLDAALEEGLRQRAVEGGVERPAAVGLHARPRDREPVALESERRHQVDVLAEAVVVVACDVPRLAASDRAGDAAEDVRIDRPRPSSAVAPSIW